MKRLRRLLAELDVETIAVPMPPRGVQHLLGVVNLIDRDLAAIRSAYVAPELLARFEEEGIDTIALPEDSEVTTRGAMNFVALGPRKLLMPANCPATRARYEAAGVTVYPAEVGEYLAAAGGLGCLTGIVSRRPLSEVN